MFLNHRGLNIPVLAAAMNQTTHFHIANNIVADFSLMIASMKDFRANILPGKVAAYKKEK